MFIINEYADRSINDESDLVRFEHGKKILQEYGFENPINDNLEKNVVDIVEISVNNQEKPSQIGTQELITYHFKAEYLTQGNENSL